MYKQTQTSKCQHSHAWQCTDTSTHVNTVYQWQFKCSHTCTWTPSYILRLECQTTLNSCSLWYPLKWKCHKQYKHISTQRAGAGLFSRFSFTSPIKYLKIPARSSCHLYLELTHLSIHAGCPSCASPCYPAFEQQFVISNVITSGTKAWKRHQWDERTG